MASAIDRRTSSAPGVITGPGVTMFTRIREHLGIPFLHVTGSETEALARTVRSLKVRLEAIDTATPSADLADLRQSIGQIKSTVVTPRELSGALAQLSQRVDKLDRDESAIF